MLWVLLLLSTVTGGAVRAQTRSADGTAPRQPPGAPAEAFLREVAAMDRVEDLTEDLAAAMIEMADAFQRGEDERVLGWLAPEFRGELPFEGEPARSEPHAGFTRLVYPTTTGRLGDRGRWIAALRARVAGWGRLEDVRIKVKDAKFPPGAGGSGQAVLRMHIQGRPAPEERRAITALLETETRKISGRWTWTSAKLRSLDELRTRRAPFVEVSAAAGVADNSGCYLPGRRVRGPESLGQGAAALDIDGDGRVDLFVPSRPFNHLYRNLGDGTFEDVARSWGVAEPAGGSGALAVDFDNDGLEDLFMCYANYPGQTTSGSLTLWRNTGKGFRDVSRAAGIEHSVCAVSASAADYDGDGLLDIYVCCAEDGERLPGIPPRHATNAQPNLLFHNLGGGRFAEVAALAGVNDTRWSFSAPWADFDGDGRPDLYVVNDRGDKGLFRNEGNGRFRDVATNLGVVDSGAGMGGSWGDYDGDGLLDLYVSNMSSTAGNRILKRLYPQTADARGALLLKFARGNSLFRWDGKSFTDRTREAGVGEAEWAWGNAFFDADSDGWLDLFVANGNKTGRSKRDT